VVKNVLYDSFGRVISDSNPEMKVPFGFAGGLQDGETRLVRFGYRDYDPEVGRWMAKDPFPDESFVLSYRYCGQRPTNRQDPLGLFSVEIGGGASATLVGGVTGKNYYIGGSIAYDFETGTMYLCFQISNCDLTGLGLYGGTGLDISLSAGNTAPKSGNNASTSKGVGISAGAKLGGGGTMNWGDGPDGSVGIAKGTIGVGYGLAAYGPCCKDDKICVPFP
ncbi:RHS repeat-associated core domain-containing protein, partial [Megalodesulfovibrio gigas]